ncbi:hypothetical protein [Mucilaginibacter gracilis]|uniref:hypothetical protein n=1 Tax=Mucilaginibacter gracilis TaxID=423350 RepID=UPI0011C38403|nr:hypothetical protein [Mucilaginibacter gracilis]
MKEERAKRKDEYAECSSLDRMDDGSFALKRSKSRARMIVVYVAIIFEIFLNYISTLIFIQGEGLLYFLVRWGIAIILAVAAMLVTDALLFNLLPSESVRIKGGLSKIEDDAYFEKTEKTKRLISLILLPILLVAVEIAILGVAKKRAEDLESNGIDILFYGFILLSMSLPIIAGYFKWHSEQHGKLYKNTERFHEAKKMYHVLNLSITATMKDIKNVVENSSRKAWDVFVRFKLYKENYNRKNNIPIENIETHYCRNSEMFFAEALNRFGDEVKLILKELQENQK